MNSEELLLLIGEFRIRGYNNVREFLMQQRRRKGHQYISYAVRTKIVPRAKDCICIDCGKSAYCYDHRDYSKPTEIEPVCGRCQGLRGPGLPYPITTAKLIGLYEKELQQAFCKHISNKKNTKNEILEAKKIRSYLDEYLKEKV